MHLCTSQRINPKFSVSLKCILKLTFTFMVKGMTNYMQKYFNGPVVNSFQYDRVLNNLSVPSAKKVTPCRKK